MYSVLQRLNASVFHGLTVLFFCAVACNVTVWFDTYQGLHVLKNVQLVAQDRPVKLYALVTCYRIVIVSYRSLTLILSCPWHNESAA